MLSREFGCLIILNKSLCEKSLILNLSEFPVQKYVNKLIKCKIAPNIFLVLVLEVLGLGFLDTYHPNSLDNIVHTAAKGRLNRRKTPQCFGRRTC